MAEPMLGFNSRVPWQVPGERETILEYGHGREIETDREREKDSGERARPGWETERTRESKEGTI